MAVIIITGNPVSGHNYYGPFDTADSATGYVDHVLNDCEGEDWWVAPLVTPEVELPLHYPGAAVPIPPAIATWEPTHYSVKDGSGAVMVIGNKFNRTITLVNENGDQWTDPIDEWEPA